MRRWGALRAVALAAAAVVLLSGCLKLDVNLTVRSDDKVDGTFIVAIDKKVAALLPGGAANLDQLISNGDQPEVTGAEDVKVTPYEDDQFVGQQVTFKGAPLEEAGAGTGNTGDLTIKHDGDVYRLTGTLDLTLDDISADVPGNINAQDALANSQVRIQVTFPGKIESSNGSNSGCSVTWEPKFGTQTELDAVAKDSGGCRDGLRWWAWPLFALGLLVLIGACIGIVHVLRKEREKDRKVAEDTRGEASGETSGETAGGLAPPTAGGLAPPVVEGLTAPSGEGLSPPPGTALSPPAPDLEPQPEPEGLSDEPEWPPPGSNLPPPPS